MKVPVDGAKYNLAAFTLETEIQRIKDAKKIAIKFFVLNIYFYINILKLIFVFF